MAVYTAVNADGWLKVVLLVIYCYSYTIAIRVTRSNLTTLIECFTVLCLYYHFLQCQA